MGIFMMQSQLENNFLEHKKLIPLRFRLILGSKDFEIFETKILQN